MRVLPLLLLAGAALAAEPDATERAKEALRFAESLAVEKDYYRAVTEYKRAAFLAPGSEVERQAFYGIGMAYRAGEKWEPSVEAFRRMGDERGEFEAAETLRLSGDADAARDAFRAFLEKFPKSQDSDRARLRLASCLARLKALKEAAEVLQGIPESSPCYPEAKKGREDLAAPPDLRPKSPALAGTLSAVLPGAGQCYAGRPAGGAATFLVNGLLIGGTVESFRTDRNALGALLGLAALAAYGGNVYGAVGDAHKANREAEEIWLQGVEKDLGVSLAWTVRF